VIEQNGKRAVLLPCEGVAPDFELDPDRSADPGGVAPSAGYRSRANAPDAQ